MVSDGQCCEDVIEMAGERLLDSSEERSRSRRSLRSAET
jgi:hypothetical protein